MRELELRNLIDRIPQNAEFVAKETAAFTAKHIVINNSAALAELCAKLGDADIAAFHIDGVFSVSIDDSTQYDIMLGQTLLDAGLSEEEVYSALKPISKTQPLRRHFSTAKQCGISRRASA